MGIGWTILAWLRTRGAPTLKVLLLTAWAPRLAAQAPVLSPRYASWIVISESRSDIIRLDTSRIIDYENYLGVWLLLQRKRALRDASGRDLRGSAFFEEIDCGEHRSRRWEIHALDEHGTTIEAQTFTSSAWARFRDHVLGEQPLLLTCFRLDSLKLTRPQDVQSAR